MPREQLNYPDDGVTPAVSVSWGRGPRTGEGDVKLLINFDVAPPDERHEVHLNRQDVNNLITWLRRARDQAWGADR